MKKIIILLLLFSLKLIHAQAIQFFQEDLDFKIAGKHFYVDGLYFFRNTSDTKLTRRLFYPFPQDDAYGKVDSIFIINVQDTSKNPDLKINDSGSSFNIHIDADSTAIYRIGYRQELKIFKAGYILTTTQNWGIPFKQVNYTLEFPKEFLLDSLSYIPDSLREESDRYIFFWHKENFMPDKDFEIIYHKRGSFK